MRAIGSSMSQKKMKLTNPHAKPAARLARGPAMPKTRSARPVNTQAAERRVADQDRDADYERPRAVVVVAEVLEPEEPRRHSHRELEGLMALPCRVPEHDRNDERDPAKQARAEPEAEVFLADNFSVSASNGIGFTNTDPGGAGSSETSFSTFGNNFTNIGFHFYFFGGGH